MDSLEVNKAFAAVLTAGIAFMVTGLIGNVIVRPERLEHSAIQIGDTATSQATQAPTAGPVAAAPEPITPLLANASAPNGQAIAGRLCVSCHSFNQGGRNGVGPNLYGVVGAPHGHAEGFAYSNPMKAMHDRPWTDEELNAWLLKPNQYMPGTRMAFAGLSNTSQRADVIAYLRSISPNAPPP